MRMQPARTTRAAPVSVANAIGMTPVAARPSEKARIPAARYPLRPTRWEPCSSRMIKLGSARSTPTLSRDPCISMASPKRSGVSATVCCTTCANLIILEEQGSQRVGRKGYLAAGILAFSLGLAATGVMPIALATLTGAALVVLGGCIRLDEAYRAIEWRTVFLIACMIPLGVAMLDTRAASFLAATVPSLTGRLGPLAP